MKWSFAGSTSLLKRSNVRSGKVGIGIDGSKRNTECRFESCPDRKKINSKHTTLQTACHRFEPGTVLRGG